MPMSEDRSVLRTSIIPQMLDTAVYNMNRKQDNLAIFEMGTVFYTEEQTLTRQPQEIQVLSLLLTGVRREKQWNIGAEKVDFFDIKGALETVFDYFGLSASIRYVADQPQSYHPGRSASVWLDVNGSSQRIGTLGQIHPELQQSYGLNDTYVAEIALQQVIEHANSHIQFRELARFPSVERDIALVVNKDVEAGELLRVIHAAGGELLQDARVFDVFTGSKLGEDKKSVAISLTYRHWEHTLTDEEINAAHTPVVTSLEQTFGAELRK